MIDLILELLSKLFIIYLAIAFGIIWRFSGTRFYKPEYGKWFTNIVIWVFFPIAVFSSMIEIQTLDLSIFLVIGIFAVIIHVASYLSIILISPNEPLGPKAMTATFFNGLLYPFPIIIATVGQDGLFYSTIFVFYILILRNTFGVFIGIRHATGSDDSEEPSLDIKKVMLGVMKFPPFIAMVIGLFANIVIGSQDFSSFELISVSKDLSMYGGLVIVGLSFQNISQIKFNSLFSDSTIKVGLVRFLIAPIISLVVLLLFQFPSLAIFVLMVQSTSPPAISNIIYAKFFNIKEDEVSIFITSLTFIALLILPFELILYQFLFL